MQEGYHDVNETATVTIQVIEKPVIELYGQEQVEINQTGYFAAYISMNGEPLEGQSVSFSVSGPASVDQSPVITGTDGYASSSITAGNMEGTAVITASCTVEIITEDSSPLYVPLYAEWSMRIGQTRPVIDITQKYAGLQGYEPMEIDFMAYYYPTNGEYYSLAGHPFSLSITGPGTLNTTSINTNEYGGARFTVTAKNETGDIMILIESDYDSPTGEHFKITEPITIPVTKTPTWHGTLTYESFPRHETRPNDLGPGEVPYWDWHGATLTIDFVFDESYRLRHVDDYICWNSPEDHPGSGTGIQSVGGFELHDYVVYPFFVRQDGSIAERTDREATLVSKYEPVNPAFIVVPETRVVESNGTSRFFLTLRFAVVPEEGESDPIICSYDYIQNDYYSFFPVTGASTIHEWQDSTSWSPEMYGAWTWYYEMSNPQEITAGTYSLDVVYDEGAWYSESVDWFVYEDLYDFGSGYKATLFLEKLD